ncbi:MAG TPA: hypothetical protein VNL14_11190 [Candidatus Acidoferrales bacterium]|nr:hypothetical protein [Candidatus Acidoferrales bacterium]
MADAEDRRAREPLAHQAIKARLRDLVDGRSRLIEEKPVGLLHERARESDALLLAGRKLQRPMSGLVEPPGEPGKADGLERLGQRLVVRPPAGMG